MSDEDKPKGFADKLKTAFTSGSKLAGVVLTIAKSSALIGAYGIGFYAEAQADHAKTKVDNRTEATYEALRDEVEALWAAHEKMSTDVGDVRVDLGQIVRDVRGMDLRVRDIALEDRLASLEKRLSGRSVGPQKRSEEPSTGTPPRPPVAQDALQRIYEYHPAAQREKLPSAEAFFDQQKDQKK